MSISFLSANLTIIRALWLAILEWATRKLVRLVWTGSLPCSIMSEDLFIPLSKPSSRWAKLLLRENKEQKFALRIFCFTMPKPILIHDLNRRKCGRSDFKRLNNSSWSLMEYPQVTLISLVILTRTRSPGPCRNYVHTYASSFSTCLFWENVRMTRIIGTMRYKKQERK